jgi:hypothetical protein
LSFPRLPAAAALRAGIEAEIPLPAFYDDIHGKPAWRRQVTLQFAEEIRVELGGDGAGGA